MELKQLSVKNFKCFNASEIDFSKLNIFTGSNSSGKSSMLDAILSVAQSANHFPFRLSPNGKYVIMGDYYEFARNHSLTKPIEISLKLVEGKTIVEYHTTWANDESIKMPIIKALEAKTNGLLLSVFKDKNYHVHIELDEEKYKRGESYKGAQIISEFMNKITDGKYYSDITKEFENINVKTSTNTIDFNINDLKDIGGVLIKSNRQFVDFALTPIERSMQNFDSNFNYISSFRLRPERTYTQSSQSDLVKASGENAIAQIFQWKAMKSPKFKELMKELRNLQLMNTLTINKLRGGRYEVRVRTKLHGAWASLVDVGFGISQYLPIIVADLQLRKGSTLMIDQPEIHLHPSVQAQLADYFIRQVKSNNKRYFIETHSEYILNRLRASIVKGIISPSSVRVYYFDNQSGEPEIHQVHFTKSGKILNAPKGFFETYMIDVMDIALSTVDR